MYLWVAHDGDANTSNVEIDERDLEVSQDQLIVCKDLGLTCQICSTTYLRNIQNWPGMGWDGIDCGYGVATALKIVQWPTAFPSQAFRPLGQQGYSKEKSPPRPKPEQPYNITVFKFVDGVARTNRTRRREDEVSPMDPELEKKGILVLPGKRWYKPDMKR